MFAQTSSQGRRKFLLPRSLAVPAVGDRNPTVTQVCITAFLNMTGWSRNLVYYRARALTREEHQGTVEAKAWLIDLKSRYGASPVTGHVYPPYTSSVCMYRLFKFELPENTTSRTTFDRMWRSRECSAVRVRKHSTFSVCDTCHRLKAARDYAKTAVEREAQILALSNHDKTVVAERTLYERRRLDAIQDSETYMSMIVDGADQSAYDLPHFFSKSTSVMNAYTIPLQLLGHAHRMYG